MAKRRLLTAAEIAAGVVADLREEGWTDIPFIPADLDDEIRCWCELQGVEPIATMLVREEIATLPGVRRTRPWLNAYDPNHRYLRRRQRARGEENDRPTVYLL